MFFLFLSFGFLIFPFTGNYEEYRFGYACLSFLITANMIATWMKQMFVYAAMEEIIIRRYYSDKANVIRENRTKAGHDFRRIILTSLAKEIIEAARQRQLEEGIENPEYIFMMNDRFKSFYDRSAREERARQLENARVQISFTGAA